MSTGYLSASKNPTFFFRSRKIIHVHLYSFFRKTDTKRDNKRGRIKEKSFWIFRIGWATSENNIDIIEQEIRPEHRGGKKEELEFE